MGVAMAVVSGLAVAFAATWAPRRRDGPLVVLVGDSLMADGRADKPDGPQGWGRYLDVGGRVVNLAVSGQSTSSYLAERRFALALARRPDWLLVGFGHNDAGSAHRGYSATPGQFSANLRRMVADARAKAVRPLLVTPVAQFIFTPDGRHDGAKLAPYAQAVRDVASEAYVTLIDLYAATAAEWDRLGPDARRVYGVGGADDTHLNAAGARFVAGLVAASLNEKPQPSAGGGEGRNGAGGQL
jgi:lysophospholipase L1-like esterase